MHVSIFLSTMVLIHCLETHEQQRKSEVPRRRKTRKEISDPQAASSTQRNICIKIYIYIYIYIYMFIFT